MFFNFRRRCEIPEQNQATPNEYDQVQQTRNNPPYDFIHNHVLSMC